MPTSVTNRTRGAGIDARHVRRTADALLAAVGERDSELALVLVRDSAVRILNRDHRDKDAPTDVLSFPALPPEAFDRRAITRRHSAAQGPMERHLGDIVISVDAAARQAAAYDAPLIREIERLLIHGVLHLCGHDHYIPHERELMDAEERRLADVIGMPWPYLSGERESPTDA